MKIEIAKYPLYCTGVKLGLSPPEGVGEHSSGEAQENISNRSLEKIT
jgi:hypothetical protein